VRKIPTLFVRDENDRRYVTAQVTAGCEWVFTDPRAMPTRKYDGTCVMFDGTQWWARREVKAGKNPPPNYQPISTDETTGKTVGWEPIEQSAFAKFHGEAIWEDTYYAPGTYELIGPKINGNPEDEATHVLIEHASAEVITLTAFDFQEMRERFAVLAARGIEGLVWHHPDGRMCKLKVRDFPRTAE